MANGTKTHILFYGRNIHLIFERFNVVSDDGRIDQRVNVVTEVSSSGRVLKLRQHLRGVKNVAKYALRHSVWPIKKPNFTKSAPISNFYYQSDAFQVAQTVAKYFGIFSQNNCLQNLSKIPNLVALVALKDDSCKVSLIWV